LYAADAAVLDRRLMDMVNGVCDEDPRTIAQRRADALGALAAGADRLACTCGNADCPSAGSDGRAANVVIHVVAEAAALDAQPDPRMSGTFNSRDPEPASAQPAKPAGLLIGANKIVPAPLLAELIRSGAKVRDVQLPSDLPESGYRPSAALERFVRLRDLTCRFPNCEEPAEFCDLDHTIPYPLGPTHPSNLAALCRKHHLLKTFWTGVDGWANEQFPDATVIWTAPTGRTYTTLPGSRIFFPHWNTTTADLPKRQALADSDANRALMMPRRRRTRTAARAARIRKERALNAAARAELAEQTAKLAAARNKPPPDDWWNIDLSTNNWDDDPPPF
jgi:hypothetical protein